MGLGKYFRKRRFGETPEPQGPLKKTPSKKLAFVIQEHHASRLHYDFRLEIDGVLKSWAIPKGPSLDPHEHHLAIQTEDHPFAYRNFEGVIPEGNYGAGNVIIWDEGWYEARKGDPKDSEKILRAGLKNGHLTFILHGKKLRGEFALIKMAHAKEENTWLLVKKGDEFATAQDVTKQDESVRSHRHVDDLGAHGKLPDLSAYPHVARPWPVKPMLSTLVGEPFSKEGWLFEIKWDGYRAVGSKHKNSIELYSRNNLDFSQKYQVIIQALQSFKNDIIVDGEIVAVGQDGNAHFEWLQNYHKQPQGELVYYIFDILWCNGRDVRTMPLWQRKNLLKAVLPPSKALRFSDHIPSEGRALFKKMQKCGLEGMVAKRAESPYRENDRGQDWLKVKTHLRQEVVVGGYTEPRGSRKHLGSLIVGTYENGKLVYTGHSGGGIPDEQRKLLHQKLLRLERKTSPFMNEPKPNAPAHWVRPELVCEMSFSEWTSEGYMRQPQFEGLRPDKNPMAVHREKPKTTHAVAKTDANANTNKKTKESAVHPQLELTHLNKIFFPKHKYTKGDLIAYYESVAKYILPYLKDRPHLLNRMPDGIIGPGFYQKNNEHLPGWIPSANIFSESNSADLHWIVGGSLGTLKYMVQLGCIEINPWNSRVGHLDHPDWIVIDLDPEGVGFKQVVAVANTVKTVCDEWGIPTFPKTSGKTGIHIYIPLHAKYTYEQGKNLAHLIALEVNDRQPDVTSVERMPKKRKHKIYLDFLQNREGQTLAAPYSVRPTPDATVSMPLHWDEVNPSLDPTDFTIATALGRLSRTGDLWKPVLQRGPDLQAVLKKIENARRQS